ncbi:MAG: nuclear transport factor 2 family protein, partial [Gemmatimonadota bacterium]|nr:nuclear transport factor 2 family protein [Gemmatimonadota bacterium]
DLEAFMAIYADAPTTSFMTFDGPVYGRESIKTGYAAAFAPGGPRDSLRFEDLTVRQLPPLIGLATARYVLHRGGQVTSTGWFTIVLRRVGGGWLVIHDHSSESPLPATDQPEEAPE